MALKLYFTIFASQFIDPEDVYQVQLEHLSLVGQSEADS